MGPCSTSTSCSSALPSVSRGPGVLRRGHDPGDAPSPTASRGCCGPSLRCWRSRSRSTTASGSQALLTFTVGFGPLVVFAASFVNPKSVWKLGRLDYTCGALSVARHDRVGRHPPGSRGAGRRGRRRRAGGAAHPRQVVAATRSPRAPASTSGRVINAVITLLTVQALLRVRRDVPALHRGARLRRERVGRRPTRSPRREPRCERRGGCRAPAAPTASACSDVEQ